MADIRKMVFERWVAGTQTKHPPSDALFMRTAEQAGFEAFTHTGGLFGARSHQRGVHVINRGRGRKWEVVFLEGERDVVTTMTTDLEGMTITMLSWLSGRSLTAEENSVRAVAG